MASTKTLEAKLRLIDETAAASRSASENVLRIADAYKQVDAAKAKAKMQGGQGRDRIDLELSRQKIGFLEREVRMGSAAAAIELQRARITQQYTRDKERLNKITRDENATLAQQQAAYRQLIALHKQFQAQMGLAGRGALSIGGAAVAIPGGGGGAGGGGRFAGVGGGVAGQLRGMLGAYIGMQTMGQVMGKAQESGEARAGFERSLTDLVSMGDNAKGMDGLRQRVVELSNATGRTKEQIADMLFFIQSGTVGAGKAIQEDITNNVLKMGRATNAELQALATALIKSYRIFGREVADVSEIADKLFVTAERGFISHQELAHYVTQVLSSGEAFGFKFVELLGAISVATKSSNDAEGALTALRNILLRFNNAEKEGIKFTGDLVDRLEQLSAIDPNTLNDWFGDRTTAVLFDLVRRTGELRDEIAAIGPVTGELDKRLSQMGANFSRTVGTMLADLKTLNENLKMGGSSPGGVGTALVIHEAAMAEARESNPLAPDWAIFAQALWNEAFDRDAGVKTMLALAEQKMKAGDLDGAQNYLNMATSKGAIAPTDRQFHVGPDLPGVPSIPFERPLTDNEKRFASINDQMREERRKRTHAETVKRFGAEMDKTDAANREREALDIFAATGGFTGIGPAWSNGERQRTPVEEDLMRKAIEDKTGAAISKLRALKARAVVFNQTIEQALHEDVGGAAAGFLASGLGQQFATFFGGEHNKDGTLKAGATPLQSMLKSLFGEGPETFLDKALGRSKAKGNLLPALGDLLAQGAGALFGKNGAAIVDGLRGAKRGREPREIEMEKFGTTRYDQYYHGLSEQQERDRAFARAMQEVADGTAVLVDEVKAMKEELKNIGVLTL